jgi:hypothetical protein
MLTDMGLIFVYLLENHVNMSYFFFVLFCHVLGIFNAFLQVSFSYNHHLFSFSVLTSEIINGGVTVHVIPFVAVRRTQEPS